MHVPVLPLLANLGRHEILLVLAVLMLLFGAKKLPELARGTGRALRIFKAETDGLMSDDDQPETEEHGEIATQRGSEAAATDKSVSEQRNIER